jgi:hypothetical protein
MISFIYIMLVIRATLSNTLIYNPYVVLLLILILIVLFVLISNIFFSNRFRIFFSFGT